MKKIITVLMAIGILITSCAMFGCGKKEIIPTDAFVPIIRFAVLSDMHFDDGKALSVREKEILGTINDIYRYSAEHKYYKKLDAVLSTGDAVNAMSDDFYKSFVNKFLSKLKEETQFVGTLGNHEFLLLNGGDGFPIGSWTWSKFDPAVAMYKKYIKQEPSANITIKGFHFITNTPQFYATGMSYDYQAKWLAEQVQAATKDTPNAPVFVMQHYTLPGTMLGSPSEFDMQSSYDALKAYPHVINFSGHTHVMLNTSKIIHQNDFTALTAGAFRYAEPYLGLNVMNGVTGQDIAYPQCLVVEVDAKNQVQINAYDYLSEKMLHKTPFKVDIPAGKEGFTYTNKYVETVSAPHFLENNNLVATKTDSGISVNFDAAVDDELVYYYTINLLNSTGKIVKSIKIESEYYNDPMPKRYGYRFSGNIVAVKAQVIAYNAYDKASSTIEVGIT